MKQVFLTFGLYIQEVPNINTFPNQIKQRLKDQYIQQWSANLNLSNKCRSYRIFKLKFELEKYLCSLSPFNRKIICRFRTSNHRLPIEREDTMASIEKTEHVNFVILIKFVMNSTLYSNVIPILIYGKLSYRPTVKIIPTI